MAAPTEKGCTMNPDDEMRTPIREGKKPSPGELDVVGARTEIASGEFGGDEEL
jgi:hypothetical protein